MINWDLDLDNLYNPYDENYFEEENAIIEEYDSEYSYTEDYKDGGILLAVYAIPEEEKYDVDPCWLGAHITLAGFAHYPTRAGPGQISYQQALNVIERAANACRGRPWHASENDAHFTSSSKVASRSPQYRHLEFGTKNHPSHTLHEIQKRLESGGIKKVFKPGRTLGPHTTFDQCGCYSSCPDKTFADWEKNKVPWTMIPVTAPVGTDFTHINSCTKLPGHTKVWTHGQCDSPYNIIWHTDRGNRIYSC